MKWENLKDGKCPKCEGKLYERGNPYIYCEQSDFTISKIKFKEITSSEARTEWKDRKPGPLIVDEVEQNQAALNDL